MMYPLPILVVFSSMHTALLVTSTVAGAKLVALPFGLSCSGTVLSYALTFVLLDSIAELYGAALSRLTIYVGLAAMMTSALYLKLTTLLPPAAYFTDDAAFRAVISASWRIWLAGWLAYIVSQRVDLALYLFLKRSGLAGQAIASRASIGMIIGQLVDTAVFVCLAFWGTGDLIGIIAGQYLVKVVIAAVSVPLVGWTVGAVRSYAGRSG